MRIKTFVFLDSETTGLPAFEHNKTKITELCLISVQAEHICLGVVPRVQNKLNLCFNPMKRIQPDAERITGLYNDDLDAESSFNEASINLLLNFLERLSKPTCFVAHNGFGFDYPILRTHIDFTGKSFPDSILCIDSLRAFREILNKPATSPNLTSPIKCESFSSDSKELSDEWDEVLYNEVLKIEESLSATQQKCNNVEPQTSNETTPPTKKQCNVPAAPRHRRIQSSLSETVRDRPSALRRLDFSEIGTKKQSFKLGDVYQRLLQKTPTDAHHAEADVNMLLECAVNLGDVFVNWANDNAISFNQIPKMEPGKKIGV